MLIRKKSLLHVQTFTFFLLIRSIVVVFSVLLIFTLSLVSLDFIFSLRNLEILKRASLLAAAKSIFITYTLSYTGDSENMYVL